MRVGISARDAAWTILAAVLAAAAFPPFGLWPLMLVSIIVLLRMIGEKPAGEARVVGLVYGAVFGAGTMYWMFNIFGLYAITLIALMAGYFGVFTTLVGLTRGNRAMFRALATGLFAVAIEWLRGDAWYLRFPWYTPPHALAQSPAWISLARWTGTYGLSLVIWTICAWSAFGRFYNAGLLLVLPAFAVFLLPIENPEQKALLVQAEEPGQLKEVLESIPYTQAELAVLPEYAFPNGLKSALHSVPGPVDLARKLHCPVVFGTVVGEYGRPGFQNVAAVLDSNGTLLGTFAKQRPVPLMLDGAPGTERPVFPYAAGVLGIGLCYDFDAPVIASSVTDAGATVLVAPTGDFMWWGQIQHVHHGILVRLRAVENDRWVLRATTSGISEAIDPHGYASAESLKIGESGSVIVSFGSRDTFALGSQFYLLGPLAAIATGLGVVFVLLKKLTSAHPSSLIGRPPSVTTETGRP